MPGAECHSQRKHQVPAPEGRDVLGTLEYNKEASMADIMTAK